MSDYDNRVRTIVSTFNNRLIFKVFKMKMNEINGCPATSLNSPAAQNYDALEIDEEN